MVDCEQCGKEFDSISALRMHYLGSPDHEYVKDQFKRLYESSGDETAGSDEASSTPSPGREDADPSGSEDSSPAASNQETANTGGGGEIEIDMSGYSGGSDGTDTVKEDTQEQVEDQETTVQKKDSGVGLESAVNNAWGRIFTMDLDPDDQETENVRKNLAGLAEDVGLGQNVNRFYQERLRSDGEMSPEKAVATSVILAAVISLAQRPDLAKKMKKKMDEKRQENSGGGNDEE